MLYVLLMKSKDVSLMLIESNTNEKSIFEILRNYQHDYLVLPKNKFKHYNNKFTSLLKIGNYLISENQKFEKRIAITPDITKKYISLGIDVSLPQNYANHLGFKDEEYKE